jgi:hypothetical protein
VIDFDEMNENAAASYREPYEQLARSMKEWRQSLDPTKYRRIVVAWWKHFHAREALYQGILERGLTRVIARSRVSNRHMLAFVPNNIFYLDAVVVFLFDSDAALGVLQSSLHEAWCHKYGSRLKADLRYGAKNCFNTFPFPDLQATALAEATLDYIRTRQQVMEDRGCGLTVAYQLLDEPQERDSVVESWRRAFDRLDESVVSAYDLSSLDVGHGFHQTTQGIRYTISGPTRTELLDRLLELNHERAAAEAAAGLTGQRRGGGRRGGARRRRPADGQTSLEAL